MNDFQREIRKIEETIRREIREYDMLPSGSSVVIGLSGGADSVCLAHFLWSRREEYGIAPVAVHVNHLLRGSESFRDERYVEALCREWGMPLRIFRADAALLAREGRLSEEECGRKLRYSFFARCLTDGGRIATAHTASDQVETVLFHLAKGSGIRGLAGIPPVRGQIVRPLLEISRREVEAYCRAYHLSYVTDRTNLVPEYDRNRIRLEAVPVLKRINPRLEESVSRMRCHLAEDEAFLQSLAEKALENARLDKGWSRGRLAEEPVPVLSRAVDRMLRSVNPDIRLTSGHVEDMVRCIQNGGAVDTVGNLRLLAKGKRVYVESSRRETASGPQWSVRLRNGGAHLPDGREVQLHLIEEKNRTPCGKINNLLFNNRQLYDTIQYIGVLRNRRPGDFFRPAGRGITKSLKKFFNEKGIPPRERETLLLLAEEGSSEILWIEGIGACDSLAEKSGRRGVRAVLEIQQKKE